MTSSTSSALQGVLHELKAFALFQDYPLSSLEKLCYGAEVHICKHRQKLFQFGEPATHFGIVLSGAFKLSRLNPLGEDLIMHFSQPGDVVAAFIMAQTHPKYPVSVTAMGPSRFLSIPRQTYNDIWKTSPDLILRIQNLLSTRMSQFHDQKAMMKSPLPARIAELLLKLADQTESEALQVAIPLTRKEIADTLGVTVESVIRVMSEWSKHGIIQTTDQQITITDSTQILKILESEN